MSVKMFESSVPAHPAAYRDPDCLQGMLRIYQLYPIHN